MRLSLRKLLGLAERQVFFFTPYTAAVLLMGLSTLQTGWRCEVEEKIL